MEKKRVLIVDDDSLFRDCMAEILRRKGYEYETAANGNAGLEAFRSNQFDLIVSDMKMPGMSGIELLEHIRQQDPDIPFLVITAHGDIDSAVDAMKKGASDYLAKSDNIMVELEFNVERLLEYRSLIKENKRLKCELTEQYTYVGETPGINEVRQLVRKVAESRSTVLISGESGTGKELIARSIHYLSPRHQGPFVKINCAALPEGLIESELFGHEKGAFTGAIKRKLGKFELASRGTLLLDEIGEMPVGMQAKLLRVLQEREIHKVGGEEPVEVDVRIVATTNRALEQEIAAGKFREDLYYRLNVFHIEVPPLRSRKDDIASLVEYFIRKFNNENGFSVEGISDEGLKKLFSYDWPGNIRELENTIERAVVLARNGPLTPAVLECRGGMKPETGGEAALRAGMTINAMEKELILKTLGACGNNRTKAAQMLDISIRTLRNKLNEYSLKTGDDDSD
jgi:DNA-binding NtrC family response regulator